MRQQAHTIRFHNQQHLRRDSCAFLPSASVILRACHHPLRLFEADQRRAASAPQSTNCRAARRSSQNHLAPTQASESLEQSRKFQATMSWEHLRQTTKAYAEHYSRYSHLHHRSVKARRECHAGCASAHHVTHHPLSPP